MDILKTINAEYLFEIFGDNIGNLVTKELVSYALDKVNDNFNEYIKSNPSKEIIKQAGLHYFIAVYLLNKLENKSNINKDDIKKLVSEKNKVEDLSKSLLNFDFYIGSCGIEAQNLALNKNEDL